MDKLRVVTTIGMIADAAMNIGDEHVQVEALMGPAVDPHPYKASEGDVSELAGADLILFNGLHLEAKMADVLKKLGSSKHTVAVAEVIPQNRLIKTTEGEASYDPHVWFDIDLWLLAVEAVYDALVEADPENEGDYTQKYKTYRADLENLSDYVKDQVRRIPEGNRVIITAHDAFSYFGKAYGFEVRGLQGISTVSEAGTADVRELAEFITERKIPAIFIESSVPRKNVEELQAAVESRGFAVEIGGELFSDAMGDWGTFEGTYVGMVTHNIDTLVESLLDETRF
jgi:manganese/zinc/iron transport system substrate-binding protein